MGSLAGLGEEETARWEERRARLAGEKATVAVILGGGVGGSLGFDGGDEGGNEEEEGDEGSGVLGLGAKKREITCCFCFPMAEEVESLTVVWD